MAKKMKQGDIIEVEWRDAYDPARGSTWYSNLDTKDDLICHSVGYFAHRDKRYLTITGDTNNGPQAGRSLRIPIGMILKIVIR
jgi:hypothetical protein